MSLNFNFKPFAASLLAVLCFVFMPVLLKSLDHDLDGLDDQDENDLLRTYAPVVLLHLSEDRLPANVDWYLQNGWMRFHHGGWCSDCDVIPGPINPEPHPTQFTLCQQQHKKKYSINHWPPWEACSHYDNWERSWIDFDSGQCFFVQVFNSSHNGSSNPNDWIVYGHVYPNNKGGINVQYWFFYAYNDGPLTQNHEGDWECLIVELKEDMSVDDLYYYQHGESGPPLAPGDVTWYDGTHPIVMSALGSHASYQSYSACQDHQYSPISERGCYWCYPVEYCEGAWFTWTDGKPTGSPGFQGGGIRNVGEKVDNAARYLNGQKFIHYSGRWGEIGSADWTSGPRGPAYQPSWNKNRETPSNVDYTHVDDDFNSSTPGWGYDHFDNLFDGIFHVKSGGMVLVYAGTYYERLRIQKPLHLKGVDGKEVTFIDAQNQTGYAVFSLETDEIQISGFTIQNGSVGVEMDAMVADDCVFTENTVTNFTWGLYIWPGNSNNRVYHNNFINNVINGGAHEESDANIWNFGEPNSGNYWDDYTGSDNDGDGIGDSPYIIYGDKNRDYYPLMNPDGWLQLPDPYTSAVTITQGSPQGLATCPAGDGPTFQYIAVNLRNLKGDPISQVPADDITLSVEATATTEYYGTLSCTFTPIDATSDANGDIRFQVVADTSIVGDITIKATVRDYAINNTVGLKCNSFDANVDGVVDLSDLSLFSTVYNKTYDWHFDYNWDGIAVSLSDFAIFSSHYQHSH